MDSSEKKTLAKLKTVFVISPIGKPDADGVDFAKLCLEQIIKPAAKDCGGYAVPQRADEHHKPGSVTAKVVTSILDADVCVADLTQRNANVMYEVAIAHAANKPVILLQQEPGGPPFDFADERVIHYGLRVDLANAAREELVEHFKAAQDEKEDPRLAATMNPVRVLFGQLKATAAAPEPEKAVLAELQAMRAELRRQSQPEPGLRRRAPRPSDELFPDGVNVDATILMMSRRVAEQGGMSDEDLHRILRWLDDADDELKARLLRSLTDAYRHRPDSEVRDSLARLLRDLPPPF